MIRLKYVNIAEGAKENSTNITNVENKSFANINLLNQETSNTQLATLEKNYTILNGQYKYLDNDTRITYMSTILSDNTGSFSDSIILTRTYTNRYSSPRINSLF